jgi:hypothetical protein
MPALITARHLFPARFVREESETRMISGRIAWVLGLPINARVGAIGIFPDGDRASEG